MPGKLARMDDTLEDLATSIEYATKRLADLRARRTRLINEAIDRDGQTWDTVQGRARVSRATVMSARRTAVPHVAADD